MGDETYFTIFSLASKAAFVFLGLAFLFRIVHLLIACGTLGNFCNFVDIFTQQIKTQIRIRLESEGIWNTFDPEIPMSAKMEILSSVQNPFKKLRKTCSVSSTKTIFGAATNKKRKKERKRN